MSKIHTDGAQAPKLDDHKTKKICPLPLHKTRRGDAAADPHSGNQTAFTQLYAACRNALHDQNMRLGSFEPSFAQQCAAKRRRATGSPCEDDVIPDAGAAISPLPWLQRSVTREEQAPPAREPRWGNGETLPVLQGVEGASDDSLPLVQGIEGWVADDSLSFQTLASLLPAGKDDGVFEVTLPGGEKMGVVVADLPSVVSYLLRPESDLLTSRLRGHEVELEGCLKRRIGRNVKVAVL